MIYDSSKNYYTGVITMIFDGDPPSMTEVDEYLIDNYGIGVTGTVDVELPYLFRGLFNPGSITVNP